MFCGTPQTRQTSPVQSTINVKDFEDATHVTQFVGETLMFATQPQSQTYYIYIYTPPKINMEHNNGGLEDDFPFQIGDFKVPC